MAWITGLAPSPSPRPVRQQRLAQYYSPSSDQGDRAPNQASVEAVSLSRSLSVSLCVTLTSFQCFARFSFLLLFLLLLFLALSLCSFLWRFAFMPLFLLSRVSIHSWLVDIHLVAPVWRNRRSRKRVIGCGLLSQWFYQCVGLSWSIEVCIIGSPLRRRGFIWSPIFLERISMGCNGVPEMAHIKFAIGLQLLFF